MTFINKYDGFNQTSLVIGPGTGLGAALVIEIKLYFLQRLEIAY